MRLPAAKNSGQRRGRRSLAQAMAEFGLALPVLLLVVYGLIETGRLVFIYASVISAARQAARYGSAGATNSPTKNYEDCPGIRAAAKALGFIQPFSNSDITITFDDGNPLSLVGSCSTDATTATFTPSHPINGDRITVEVATIYSPIVPLVPFGRNLPIKSTSSRTLLAEGVPIGVDVTPVNFPPGGGGGGGGGNSEGQLGITKSASPLTYVSAGETITYTYKLTNNSAAPASGTSLVDNRLGGICSVPDPMPGGTQYTCTRTYTTTQADVDDQRTIKNNATFSATIDGNSLHETSVDISVIFQGTPRLTLTKTGTAPNLIPPGALLTYEFTFQNTGNVPLSPPYSIDDALIGTNWDCAQANQGGSIPAGGSASAPCTGTYALKNQDINNGFVTNTATVSAHYLAQTVTSPPASATVQLPSLLLEVSASPTSVTDRNQTITYTYTVTNRTNSSVTAPQVVDSRAGTFACGSSSLASQDAVTCTKTYAGYTQSDMDTGYFTSQISASAVGSSGSGNKTYNSNSVSLTISVVQNASLQLAKTSNAPPLSPDTGYPLGQGITYTYTLTNTGNVTLNGPYSVMDDKLTVDCSAATQSGSMNPDTSKTCTATYVLTQADLDAAMITNQATASATRGAGFVTSNEATLTIYTYNGLHLFMQAEPAYWQTKGDVITYTLILTNVGTEPVSPPYDLLPPQTNKVDLSTLDCANAPDPLQLYATMKCTATWIVGNPDPSNPTVNATAQFSAEGATGTVESNKAGVGVPKYDCGSTLLYSSGATPNPDGSDVIWNISNNTGLDVQISNATVTWNIVPPDLTQVLLGGVSIWSGGTSGVTTFPLPNPPWTLPTAATTPLEVQFYNGVPSTINVELSFAGPTCGSYPMNLPYP